MATGTASALQTSRGHGHPMYDPFVIRPMNTITAGSLKDAAATSLGKYWVPASYGKIAVLAIGITFDVAGGAQTTAGTMEVEVAGSDLEAPVGTTLVVASVASHVAGDSVEASGNQTAAADKYTTAPVYTTASDGDLIEWKVATQGVGAGTQTGHPYAIVAIVPHQ